jgi:hypothetical protein
MKTRNIVLITGGCILAAGATELLMRNGFEAPTMAPKLAKTMAERAASFAEELTPLYEGDPRWDEVLGGRTGENSWGYFSVGYGTTCGIFAADVYSRAGAPVDMINRKPPEGNGFTAGLPISKLYNGAKKIGWLMTPTKGKPIELMRGDLYCVHRFGAMYNGKPASGEHVGIVTDVKTTNSVTVVSTCDGGQTDTRKESKKPGRQCAERRERTLSGNTLSTVSGPAELVWWIRPTA